MNNGVTRSQKKERTTKRTSDHDRSRLTIKQSNQPVLNTVRLEIAFVRSKLETALMPAPESKEDEVAISSPKTAAVIRLT